MSRYNEPNTTGGQYPATFTIPDRCSHGVHFQTPCAACGRGYPAPVYNVAPDPSIGQKLDRIIALLEELASR